MYSQNSNTSLCRALKGAGRMFVLASCCALASCASLGLGGPDGAVDPTATSSIGQNSVLLAGIEPSDWNILLERISSLDATAISAGAPNLDWDNPETGSKGRITEVSAHTSVMDEECRFFKSSMHRVTGVENIEGEICKASNGSWQIMGFTSGVTA